VLIGILGGIQSFGLVGLFLGPVIMAALLTIWREWIGLGGLTVGAFASRRPTLTLSKRKGPRGFRRRSKSREETPSGEGSDTGMSQAPSRISKSRMH
jgi:hypothetical protein